MSAPVVITDALTRRQTPRAKEYVVLDSKVAGLGLRVRPSGSRSWVLRLFRAGKAQRVTLGPLDALGVTEARAMAHAVLAGAEPDRSARSLPFAKLADQFLDQRRRRWRASTLRSFECYLRRRLLPAFGQRPVARLTAREVAVWFTDLSAEKPGAANQALMHLRTILAFARETGHLAKNAPDPTARLRRNKRPERGRVLSAAQIARLGVALAEAATPQDRAAADAVRLMLMTGCRSGEILRLRWDEIEDDRLDLRTTKTGARSVHLPPQAVTLLARRRRTAAVVSPFVFPHPDNPSRPVRDFRAQWRSFRAKAGIGADVRLHDLRHTYASRAVMAGETLWMAGQLLGHAGPNSTERYTHLDGDHLLAAAETVSARIAAMLAQTGLGIGAKHAASRGGRRSSGRDGRPRPAASEDQR